MSDCSTSPLTLRLFGPFELRLHGLPTACLRSRKGQWLLALLVLRAGRDVERDWLAGTLWPDSPEAAALANLRSSLKEVRRALGEEARRLCSPTLRTLSLDLADADVDVIAFDAAVDRGDPLALEQAVALYRGPLLEGCVEAWAFQERQVREQAFLAALERLAEQALSRGDPDTAERHLRRAMAVDPLRESAQRGLMRALAAAGNEAAALLVYRELRLLLQREMATQPDAETQALFEQLRAEARRRAAPTLRGATTPSPQPQQTPPYPRPADDRQVTHLPLPLTRFIGREPQLAQVHRLLQRHRLVTLTGAGGCGKSRLALEVARDRADTAPHGVWLVELASLADPALVPQAVAATLDVVEEPGRPLTTTLAEALRAWQCLLMIDNCEHLAAGCARLAEALLQTCPQVRILATSREPLGIGGEALFRVPSLSLPDPQRILSWQSLIQSEAVRLFADRATLVSPAFTLTDGNGTIVAQICHRLDGIPLAIELAAARVKALPVEKIAERLDDRFRLLTDGSRTALPRHQTLRALIDWSHDLLSQAERVLLRRLSVFAGGWTLEAAEGVCAGDEIDAKEILDVLTSLVGKSLVVYEERDGEARYRLLETVRQYGHDRLLEADEAEVARRHRDWYLELAERAEPEFDGPDRNAWLERLETEHDNLRAALAWSNTQPDGQREELRLAVALWRFWEARGYQSEGRKHLANALTRDSCGSPAADGRWLTLQARALNAAGIMALEQGDHHASRLSLQQALEIRQRLGDKRGIAASLYWLAETADQRQAVQEERQLLEQSLSLCRELGDRRGVARALQNLGNAAKDEGDYTSARSLYEESLAIFRELGNRYNIAWAIGNLGILAKQEGCYEAARALLEESVAIYQISGTPLGNGVIPIILSMVATEQGEFARAQQLLHAVMAGFRERGHHAARIYALEATAGLEAAQGQDERAARLFGAAEALRQATGSPLPASERNDHQRIVASARAALGEEAFAAAWAAGRVLSLEQAVDYALREPLGFDASLGR